MKKVSGITMRNRAEMDLWKREVRTNLLSYLDSINPRALAIGQMRDDLRKRMGLDEDIGLEVTRSILKDVIAKGLVIEIEEHEPYDHCAYKSTKKGQ